MQKSGAKICLPIEINTKINLVLTISLFVKIVFYFVFPDHIRIAYSIMNCTLTLFDRLRDACKTFEASSGAVNTNLASQSLK